VLADMVTIDHYRFAMRVIDKHNLQFLTSTHSECSRKQLLAT
jgi:hypothetical protein